MIIVPAIDILDNKVVRVKQGKQETAKAYSDDPSSVAMEFLRSGASLVHVVDLSAAISGDFERNMKALKNLLSGLSGTGLGVGIAGGMRDERRVREFLRLGASRIVLGSLAYEDLAASKSILESAGTKRILLALDYDETSFVRIDGWKKREPERVDDALRRFKSMGFTQFLFTAIIRDGMLGGPDIATLKKVRAEFPLGTVRLIASGGVSTEDDLNILSEIGVDEVIVGKAFYEGRIRKSLLSVYNR